MTLGSRAALLALSAMSIRCGGGNPCAITSANVVMAAHAPDADHVTYLVGGDSRGDKRAWSVGLSGKPRLWVLAGSSFWATWNGRTPATPTFGNSK